jgi:LmbE family N-acetylglucosaminyl deacetylase
MKKILAVGAHPDDIEFGCGGTLLNHKLKGDFVVYVCMTSTESVDGTTGELLRSKEQNQQETVQAAQTLLCDEIEFLPFQDLHVPFSFESVSALEKIIKKYNIDTIYTHWAGDANQDHISTFKTTMAASRYVPNVFCYEQIPVPRMSENQMDINYYVDITSTFDKKIEASLCHKSQIVKYKMHGFDVEQNLKILAQFRGIQASCQYAEAFKVIKQVIR